MSTPAALEDLFALQDRHGLSSHALARYAGYDDAVLSRWRRGLAGARVSVLSDFAEVFGHEVRLVPKAKTPERATYLPKFLPRRDCME